MLDAINTLLLFLLPLAALLLLGAHLGLLGASAQRTALPLISWVVLALWGLHLASLETEVRASAYLWGVLAVITGLATSRALRQDWEPAPPPSPQPSDCGDMGTAISAARRALEWAHDPAGPTLRDRLLLSGEGEPWRLFGAGGLTEEELLVVVRDELEEQGVGGTGLLDDDPVPHAVRLAHLVLALQARMARDFPWQRMPADVAALAILVALDHPADENAPARIAMPIDPAPFLQGDEMSAAEASHTVLGRRLAREDAAELQARLHLCGAGTPWQLYGPGGLTEAELMALVRETLGARRLQQLADLIEDPRRSAWAYLESLIQDLQRRMEREHPLHPLTATTAAIAILFAMRTQFGLPPEDAPCVATA